MSALGQKRTFALQQFMSALPPKADIGAAQIDVRLVPMADISHSFDHLVRTCLHCRRDREAEGFGGL
jgi:hypothetical protein